MYFLEYEGICVDPNLAPVWSLIGTIIKIIWIGVPILLIIYGMFDLGKAVIASKEDEIKKATKAFGKRFIYAVAVFLVVWLVKFVLGTVSKIVGDDSDYKEDNWTKCWDQINK